MAEQRLFAVLMAAFAIVSFTLAFAGLYAVATWSVTQRTREIGTRLNVSEARVSQVLSKILRKLRAGLAEPVAA